MKARTRVTIALVLALTACVARAGANDAFQNEAPRAQRDVIGTEVADAPSAPRGRALADAEGWSVGTATWYGGPGEDGAGPDGMSIYTGSCKFGKNIPSRYVSAVNTDGGYDYGLTDWCGQCYEVMCVNGRQRGLSESLLGPWAGCAHGSGGKSISVMITDSCPCNHPNTESNKRWCCGGEASNRHFDLSYVAFDAIAIRHRGIVDIRYRKVSCDSLGESKYYS